MSGLEMYLLLKLDSVVGLAVAISIILGIALLIVAINGRIDADIMGTPFPKKICAWLGVPTLLFVIIATLTPTTKEMAIIYVTPKITAAISNNEELKKLPDGILSLANEWIEELKLSKETKDSATKH